MGKIITKRQEEFLHFLAQEPSFVSSFYLTGGTALAEFYLNHRLSEDLDFFCEKEIDLSWLNSLTKQLKAKLQAKNTTMQQSFNRNLVFFEFNNETIKTEFTYFPFEHIEKPTLNKKIPVDSVLDITVNKVFTLYQKPAARHFIDIYLAIKKYRYDWNDLVKKARLKFDTNIEKIQLASQLLVAKDIADLPNIIIPLPEDEWRSFLIKKAKEMEPQILK